VLWHGIWLAPSQLDFTIFFAPAMLADRIILI
jgi:hypothetical protein